MNRTPSQEKWLRFFNRVLYNVLAPLYNALDWLTFGAWWRLVRRALDHIPDGGRLLEVGFGPGKLHAELSHRAEFCAGLDLAKGMCRMTQRRLGRLGLVSRLVRGSVFELPYSDACFDFVVSTFAFSGFADGLKAMEEMARVTQSGGRVVLVDIALPDDHNRLGTMLARQWERWGDFLYAYDDLMRDAGLNVILVEEYGPGNHIRVVVGEK